jgi:outer membrane protein assembly factor BamB
VNPANGGVRWALPTAGGGNTSSAVIGGNGTIYFGSGDNNLYAANPDGTLKWKFSADWSVTSSPASMTGSLRQSAELFEPFVCKGQFVNRH